MATVDYALTTAETEGPKMQGKADFALAFAEKLAIRTMGEYETVAGNIQEVAGALAEVDKLRTNITKPLLDAKKQTDALFSPVMDKFKKAEKIVREKLAAYAQETTVARDAAAAAGDMEAVAALELPIVKGCGVTVTWAAVVEDLSQVPAQFLAVDQRALDKFADASSGQTPIPGVRFVPVAKLRVAKK